MSAEIEIVSDGNGALILGDENRYPGVLCAVRTFEIGSQSSS